MRDERPAYGDTAARAHATRDTNAAHVEDTQGDALRAPKYTFEDNFDKWTNVERPNSVFHDEEP